MPGDGTGGAQADPEQLRARIARTTPWLQLHPARAPGAESALADKIAAASSVAGSGTTTIGGSPWSGRTSTLEGVARRLLTSGHPPRSIGWVELGHPAWHDVAPDDLADALDGGTLLLDDLPLEHLPWLRQYTGRTRIVATVSGPGDVTVPSTSFASYLAQHGAAPVARATTPDELVRATFELSGAAPAVQEHLRRYLLLGGFPALLRRAPADPVAELWAAERELASQVVERTVYRRIPRDHAIREPRDLEALLVELATRPAAVASAAELGAALRLTQPTVDKYLRVLEEVGLLVLLPNWAPGEGPRRGRRVFFGDGAVRNAVLRRGAAPLADPEEMGHLLVNALIVHAASWARAHGGTVWHWRRNRDEVDLVLEHPAGSLALQIGSSRHYPIRSLVALQEDQPSLAGRCWLLLHGAPPTWPARGEAGIGRLPLVPFLLALGAASG